MISHPYGDRLIAGTTMKKFERILLIDLTILLFCFITDFQMAFSEIYKGVGEKGINLFYGGSQNLI